MTAQLLDGKALAAKLKLGIADSVSTVTPRLGRPPGLGVVLVGDDPASAIYVRNKERVAARLGFFFEATRLPATARESEVEAAVDSFNAREEIDAFLVQSPLPEGMREAAIVERISPLKDADGLHPLSLGRLVAGQEGPRPCTPSGILALLDEYRLTIEGAQAVVVGRSNIVGKPMALMLAERHATVTLCHSRTRDLQHQIETADIVVVAVGRPRMVPGAWFKPGAAVVDVGTTHVDGRVVGDVDFESAAERAGAISPVPGGVGPLTITMLLKNTVELAKAHLR